MGSGHGRVGKTLALVCLWCVLVLGVAGVAEAMRAGPNPGACYVKGARQDVRRAELVLERARRALAEARRIERATRTYSAYDYSGFAGRYVDPVPVGRWVRLARRVGWEWGTIERLMCIIARESSGYPGVSNSQGSGATGLLQIMPGNVSQPWRLSEPAYNLRSGLKLYRDAGWGQWGM